MYIFCWGAEEVGRGKGLGAAPSQDSFGIFTQKFACCGAF